MAGNIPLVGFHDFLCVLVSGNIFTGKLSTQDQHLLPALAGILISEAPSFAERVMFIDRLETMDAVIATGSGNTSRYFEYYFNKYPHIIRKNRNGTAFLSGNETEDELAALGADLFQYFGLGCRNVSKLYVPEGYDFGRFFTCIASYSGIINHHKYANNYDYRKAIMMVGRIPFLDNGFLLVKKDAALSSPVAVLHYEEYRDEGEAVQKINAEIENIQCIAASVFPGACSFPIVPFGAAQRPSLTDYADGVDTMEFLINL
jgi:hypothetical protein